MVSEIVEVYLWKSILLGAGDPILFGKKMLYLLLTLGSPLKCKKELESVTGNDSSLPEFYFSIIHKWCHLRLSTSKEMYDFILKKCYWVGSRKDRLKASILSHIRILKPRTAAKSQENSISLTLLYRYTPCHAHLKGILVFERIKDKFM
jgi:hypothetical protein